MKAVVTIAVGILIFAISVFGPVGNANAAEFLVVTGAFVTGSGIVSLINQVVK